MADADWLKIAVQSGAALLSGIAGLFIGVWQAGHKRGKEDAAIEERLRQEISDEIGRLREELMKAIAAVADNRELLVGQFHDSFAAIRQKVKDVELDMERRFLEKGEFDDFRKEYREDMRDLKAMIANGHSIRKS